MVTQLCLPTQSKRQQDVLRGIVDPYLRLRSDGYQVTQIHTDRGGEFTQEALDRWCASRSILHTFTAGDQPQSNGRAEVSVQWVKAEIRRILQAAGAPFSRWPLAARNLNERLRLKQIGIPNFLEDKFEGGEKDEQELKEEEIRKTRGDEVRHGGRHNWIFPHCRSRRLHQGVDNEHHA